MIQLALTGPHPPKHSTVMGAAQLFSNHRDLLVKSLRWLYVLVAFTGVILLHRLREPSTPILVYAQQSAEDYGLRARLDVDTKMVDRLEEKTTQIDTHLTATDNRVNEQGERISLITGVGMGISAGLGALQLFILILGKK